MTPAFGPHRRGVAAAGALVLMTGLPGCEIEPADNPELRRAASEADLESRVDSMLAASAAGWNAGDLGTFMDVYADSPETTYVGGSGLRVGYQAIRQRFAPLFRPGAERDSLRFEELRVRRLGADVAVGVARYVLHDAGEVTGAGAFTLVLARVGADWKVVHDHSSSDPRFVDADSATAGAGATDSAGEASSDPESRPEAAGGSG